MRKMTLRNVHIMICCMTAVLLMVGGRAVAAQGDSIHWYTDYQKAAKVARESHKPMFLFFTGSDWCGWCMKFQREVLDTPEFAKEAGDKFVFVELDFPRQGSQPQAVKQQNAELQREYGIDGFPSVVILDASGKKVGMTGYRAGGGAAYAEHLKSLLGAASNLQQKMKGVHEETRPVAELRTLYCEALELDRPDYAEEVLEIGLKSHPEAPFFLAERYRQLVQKGSAFEERAAVRKKLQACHEEGAQEGKRCAAVVEFQEAARTGAVLDEAIAPLVDYLKEEGALDASRWRVEMLVAQYLYAQGAHPRAKEFAEAAFASAPESFKGDIQHFLNLL